MYSYKSGLILGFHGCEESVRDSILDGANYKPSTNAHDWLGHGIYFWEYNEERALDFARKPHINKPSVLGAVLDLGHCLDLLDKKYLDLLKDSYDILKESLEKTGNPFPKNKKGKSKTDLLLRDLDCAVIENLHAINSESNLTPFDSVKGVFVEGDPIYEGAGINSKSHIQICVRNPNCIKGFFLPRKVDSSWNKV